MAKITHTFSDLINGFTYYGKVYTVNPKRRVNNRADLTVFAAIPSSFPAEPSEYVLLGTYTSAQTWIAPENGYYKFELFGASGKGAAVILSSGGQIMINGVANQRWAIAGGGGGGSGAYACSIVKMNAGDTAVLSPGGVGSTTSASFNSSLETYDIIRAGYGANGKQGSVTKGQDKETAVGGLGGAGGTASGGNVSNIDGQNGAKGKDTGVENEVYDSVAVNGGAGGAAAVAGGTVGGTGGGAKAGHYESEKKVAPGSGTAGFIKISRGNTNVL